MCRTALCGVLLAVTASWAVAQPPAPTPTPAPPPVDRKDPEAVVRAYVKACETDDVTAAVALLEDKAGMRKNVAAMAQAMTSDFARQGITFRDLLAEFAMMPLGTIAAPAETRATSEGDATKVTVTQTPTLVRTFALVKAPDGTWAIDLEASVRLTTGKAKSFISAQMGNRGGGASRSDPSRWEVRAQLQKLANVLVEYAEQHGGKLPPAATWTDELEKYCLDRSILRRKDLKPGEYGFAINVNAAGKPLPQDWMERRSVVLLVESADVSPNASVDPDALPPRKPGSPPIWVATADGNLVSLPADMSMRELTEGRAARDTCDRNLGALGRAVLAYARDHGGQLPAAASWCDDIGPYVPPENAAMKDILRCPADPDTKYGYAFNAALAGKNAHALTDHGQIVMLLHGKTGQRNEVLAVPAKVEGGRHVPGYVMDYSKCDLVVMLDGTTREIPEGGLYPTPQPEAR
jgi:hypothetical protein